MGHYMLLKRHEKESLRQVERSSHLTSLLFERRQEKIQFCCKAGEKHVKQFEALELQENPIHMPSLWYEQREENSSVREDEENPEDTRSRQAVLYILLFETLK